MELTESYPIEIAQKQGPILYVEPIAKRTVSPKQEKAKLIKRIESTLAKNRILKEKQDGLHSTVPLLSLIHI